MKKSITSQFTRKLVVMLLLATTAFTFNACKQSDDSRKKVLKIYNWADYIDENLLTEFPKWYKEQTGEDVKIVYQVFDMPEIMYTKVAMGKEDFDLACPTQYLIEKMLKNDLLLPIDLNFGKTENFLSNISPFLRNRMDAFSVPGNKAGDYMVPYMWGTSGILYNTKNISKDEVQSWSCLWDAKNKGKILMKDHYWDVYNIWLLPLAFILKLFRENAPGMMFRTTTRMQTLQWLRNS